MWAELIFWTGAVPFLRLMFKLCCNKSQILKFPTNLFEKQSKCFPKQWNWFQIENKGRKIDVLFSFFCALKHWFTVYQKSDLALFWWRRLQWCNTTSSLMSEDNQRWLWRDKSFPGVDAVEQQTTRRDFGTPQEVYPKSQSKRCTRSSKAVSWQWSFENIAEYGVGRDGIDGQ